MSSPVHLRMKADTSTASVEPASERLSRAVARITPESILRPILRLNKNNHSFAKMESPKMTAETVLNTVSWGENILATELFNSSKPMRMTKKDTAMDATYSMRAWPKGWSRSAGFAERRKLTSDMICEAASDRLLTASAVMETAPDNTPANSLPAQRMRLTIIPTMLTSVP